MNGIQPNSYLEWAFHEIKNAVSTINCDLCYS